MPSPAPPSSQDSTVAMPSALPPIVLLGDATGNAADATANAAAPNHGVLPALVLALQQAWKSGLQTTPPPTIFTPSLGASWPDNSAVFLLGTDLLTSWNLGQTAVCSSDVAASAAQQALPCEQQYEQRWRTLLMAQKKSFVVLYGTVLQQLPQIASSLQQMCPQADVHWIKTWVAAQQAQDRATQTTVRAPRMRQWGCADCDDPQCDRRLFDHWGDNPAT